MNEKALSDLKVLELAGMVSGPYCGKLLADLGAEVIKVETPGCGDGARNREPFYKDVPGTERSGLFLYLNTNKKGISLDIETSTGAALLRRLLEDVDILIENRGPSEIERLGLSYESLKAINPGLIMVSISPFGQWGPYRDYKAYDLNIWHSGGLGYVTRTKTSGDEMLEPLKGPGQQAGLLAGMYASVASLCALHYREISGRGQQIDISQQECLTAMLHGVVPPYVWEKRILGAPGSPEFPGWVIPCKDGEVYLRNVEEHQFQRFIEFLGRPAWSEEEWCKDSMQRMANFDMLKALVADWAKDYTVEEIYRKGQAHRVAFALPRTVSDLFADRQFAERNFFVEVDHPVTEKVTYPGPPFRFTETPWRIERPAPLLGEHNEEVYCQRLGLDKAELVKMREAGVI